MEAENIVMQSLRGTMFDGICTLKVKNVSDFEAKVLLNVELPLGIQKISCYFSLSGSQSVWICVKTRDTGAEYGIK